MADMDNYAVATAIRGAEFEGFLAGTLYDQGWSVVTRALDIESLISFIDSNPAAVSLLLISTDIEGLTPQRVDEINARGIKFFIFAATASAIDQFPEAVSQPTTALELLGLIRGSLRKPMIRSAQVQNLRARIFAFATPSSSTGCTTLTLNMGAELAQLGHKVLIVDAHAYFPAIASRLGVRGLNSSLEFCNISPHLWAFEVSQSDIAQSISALDRARAEFDFILVDHGAIKDFPALLTGRRWCSEALIWSTTHADELWILSKADSLAIERLKSLTSELARNTIKPQLSFIHIQAAQPKRSKSGDNLFLNLVTPLRPQRVIHLPWDTRAILAAEDERTTLFDSNDRGILRKSIAHLAGELVS